ncbi:hypothetical protein A2704_06745 [Candidatus Kaiserbacteria bacterium RIFCSPHIGHO2_01_FULL_54_36b]|uniref:DUF541 domain-containing protein n=1 Tax=Candidatus Kaiserbacteria bacterium RIFCSPHIGHO2_01_FULL_54_36b TaxID=1798483 RepID=A0A1F6CRY1_9BACT|nr:MAG: hypothetical protein A2704_06745 [Candidatus Kaiserbacteria bacterium RIFCSPHIGHO2_01_FULL_54_36b]
MDAHSPWYGLLYNAGIRISIIGVLAVLALFLAAQTISVAGNLGRPGAPATDTVTVTGQGQATMPPDVARVSFTVQNSATTVAEAQEATTEQANAAIAFVKEVGVAERDVKTLAYTISPQYSYPNLCPPGALCPAYGGTAKITGYEVSETVQVTVRNLSNVGALLEGLGTRGVQNVSGPSFALDDSTAGYDAARADAIAKAKEEARLLAGQLGVRLGRIVNFSESSDGSMSYGMGADTMVKTAAALPSVQIGENTYNASVSITYEIR